MRESETLNLGRRFFANLGFESRLEAKNTSRLQNLIKEGLKAGSQYILLIVGPNDVSNVARISKEGISIVKWAGVTGLSSSDYQLDFSLEKGVVQTLIKTNEKSLHFKLMGLVEVDHYNNYSVILDLAREPKHFPFERDIVKN